MRMVTPTPTPPMNARHREPPFQRRKLAEQELVGEITGAARRIAEACDDKRILQALLTPTGRAQLAAARTAETIWLATLLNGLGDHELAATTHVVTVIRQRLERTAREWAQRNHGGRPGTDL